MDFKQRNVRAGAAKEDIKWNLAYIEKAAHEGRKILNEVQYAHTVQQFDELALEEEPTKSPTQEIEEVENFYELKDKGGVLGKINLRVYFAIIKEKRIIVVLCVYKKEEEGQVPSYIKTKVRNRLRHVMMQLGE